MKIVLNKLKEADLTIAFILFTLCCIASFFRSPHIEETVTAVVSGF